MAKGIYLGAGGSVKNIKQIFVGVNNVARKVKRIYVGVGGVPRLSYKFDLEKIASVNLATLRRYGTQSQVGNYALFSGGYETLGAPLSTVEAIDATSYVKSNATNMVYGVNGSAGTYVGSYAVIAGGYDASYNRQPYAQFYTSSLSRANYISMGTNSSEATAVPLPSYALIAGGIPVSNTTTSYVCAFGTNTSRYSVSSLSSVRAGMAGVVLGNNALLAGGRGNEYLSYSNLVEVYNNSLVKSSAPSLTYAKDYIIGTKVGNYAIFACGSNTDGSIPEKHVDVYNSSLVKMPSLTIPQYRWLGKGGYTTNYGMVIGGLTDNNARLNTIVTFDGNLVKGTTDKMSSNMDFNNNTNNAVTINNKVFIGCSAQTKAVDIYSE